MVFSAKANTGPLMFTAEKINTWTKQFIHKQIVTYISATNATFIQVVHDNSFIIGVIPSTGAAVNGMNND